MNEFSEGLKKESSEELVEKKPNISKPPKIDLYDEFVKMTSQQINPEIPKKPESSVYDEFVKMTTKETDSNK